MSALLGASSDAVSFEVPASCLVDLLVGVFGAICMSDTPELDCVMAGSVMVTSGVTSVFLVCLLDGVSEGSVNLTSEVTSVFLVCLLDGVPTGSDVTSGVTSVFLVCLLDGVPAGSDVTSGVTSFFFVDLLSISRSQCAYPSKHLNLSGNLGFPYVLHI